MDNKIYFLGGSTEQYPIGTNYFFYLDGSIPFNLDSTLPIYDLSNDARYIHPHSYGWAQDSSIFSSGVQWLSVVCNKNGSYIYTYGRYDNANKYVMTIEDTTRNSVLSNLNITNYLAPAILLPDGRIAYIGEILSEHLWFRNIYIYNTNDGTWRNMANNFVKEKAQDGLIIIYGGMNNINLGPSPDQILVLDTKVDPFTWSTPNIDPAPSSTPYGGHTATLVGNYMIIAFGFYRNATRDFIYSNQIHMIDVSEKNNYKWVKNFIPTKSAIIGGTSGGTETTSNNTKTAHSTKSPGAAHAAIIGGTTGGIATDIF
ncbi:hypothetical protein GLOIN_2v1785948 [Rhizophagus irregularis DAOM 181602=DAOM 197198]|uniref:Galactose oxidase n=3 Tax=Rhizophagus irregularis TaxID=588596 RepID=A0A2P4P9A6_RHIID|nr:hypothetical protein GLOIN_2v1785948 [Rhizophagus irregularis DAOM 181602=DAOM 197198]POG61961.1 hypothetical protein GLOIN_2v1785948 [Rhizophagus irregularis DAOM 181602=DAOM 197198]|eukprot:XP_025168827.1 hypothetical protein GLOIN_2v1785948 [Rhizophagus irregularis DAOM 181602=DAOM 197198]